ncbi:hypothetical protein MYXA107069_35090 [Myxococcus xanthus]|nr:hypothetical protein MyxoNM_09560 [Myxococcus xanthus]SDY26068.1 hypothetical protein SAMN05444383_12833 [Myxococcus xanthus]
MPQTSQLALRPCTPVQRTQNGNHMFRRLSATPSRCTSGGGLFGVAPRMPTSVLALFAQVLPHCLCRVAHRCDGSTELRLSASECSAPIADLVRLAQVDEVSVRTAAVVGIVCHCRTFRTSRGRSTLGPSGSPGLLIIRTGVLSRDADRPPAPTQSAVAESGAGQGQSGSASMRVSEARGLRTCRLGKEVRNHRQAHGHGRSMWRSGSPGISSFAARASRKASPNTPHHGSARAWPSPAVEVRRPTQPPHAPLSDCGLELGNAPPPLVDEDLHRQFPSAVAFPPPTSRRPKSSARAVNPRVQQDWPHRELPQKQEEQGVPPLIQTPLSASVLEELPSQQAATRSLHPEVG